MKGYLWHLRHAAEAHYRREVLAMLEVQPGARMLDCGCADGGRTLQLAARIQAAEVAAIEIEEDLARQAAARGIAVASADLNDRLPHADASFDAVVSLEAIEHLHRPETFVKEVHRLLKPGGYAVIATENLASWHNIFALLLGWQPFTLSQFSEVKTAIGNPWGLDRGETWNPALRYPSFRHCLVLSYLGLKDLLETHGFVVESIRGAGYYPLPPRLARACCACDPRHSAFLTLKARKAGTVHGRSGRNVE